MFKNNIVKKRALALISCVTLAMFTTGCDKSVENGKQYDYDAIIEKKRREVAVGYAYGIMDAAKYVYIESLFDEEAITSGNAADLKVSGTPAISGTWEIVPTDSYNIIVILEDVVIDDYICNTNEENEIECEKIK